ncbi:hypothetical protein PINS_up000566 [Pythium insidiosum]|nr:hypothetical protein PINS_up000566 [Pythium insidiosum]
MEQIGLLHVLVVGLRGVGVEIAKCLAQSGVQRLTLLDDELVRQEDFSVNFLLRDSDIGKPKSKTMASRLSELSPFTDIRAMQGALTLELMLNFHVIVFAHPCITMEELVAYNEFCRAQARPIGFILAEQFGLVGRVFVDFSPTHWSLNAATESEVELRVLTKQTQCSDERATIIAKEPLVLRMFRAGDTVVLRKTNEASDEMLSNASARFQVLETVNDCTLRISHSGTASARERITSAAHLRKLQVEAITTHYSLRERLLNPSNCINPLCNDTGRSIEIHLAITGIHAFRRELGFHPASNNIEHTEQVLGMIKDLVEMNKRVAAETKQLVMTNTDCDFSTIARLVRCASTELLPTCAIVAGYAVLQVFGFTGALGRPLGDSRSQFMLFDIMDQVPSWEARPEFRSSPVNSSRQSTLQTLLGTKAASLLIDAQFMFAGLGAIGSEVLKVPCGSIVPHVQWFTVTEI